MEGSQATGWQNAASAEAEAAALEVPKEFGAGRGLPVRGYSCVLILPYPSLGTANISGHLGTSRNISGHLGTSPNISEPLGTSLKISQNLSKSLGISQNISESLKTCQNLSKSVKKSLFAEKKSPCGSAVGSSKAFKQK